MRYLILFTLLGLLFPNLYAQKITNIEASHDNIKNRITIAYDLIAKGRFKKRAFRIDMYCSQDSGKSFSNPLVYVVGDVNQVSPGENKEIKWNYFADFPNFTGRNLQFKLQANLQPLSQEQRLRKMGGPENALKSLLVPGLGNYRVSEGRNYWIITAASLGLVGSGLYYRLQASSSYDDYLASTSPEQADSFYDQFEDRNQLSNILLIGGAAIWIGDVIWVAIKGFKNKKQLKNNTLGLRMDYDPNFRQPMLGIKGRF